MGQRDWKPSVCSFHRGPWDLSVTELKSGQQKDMSDIGILFPHNRYGEDRDARNEVLALVKVPRERPKTATIR